MTERFPIKVTVMIDVNGTTIIDSAEIFKGENEGYTRRELQEGDYIRRGITLVGNGVADMFAARTPRKVWK